MKNLLKLHVRNLFHSKLFYVCLGITILSPILSFITELIAPNISSLTEEIFKDGIPITKVFPEFMGFMKGGIGLVGKIFIALFCCLEFTEGTTKNIIARGYTRTQYLLSKFITTILGLFVMYLITFVITFILFIKNGLGFESNMIYQLIICIFETIAIATMFSTFSILLEKNGSAIIACLFIPTGVTLLLTVCDSYLKLNVSKYWIENISMMYSDKPIISNFWISILYYALYTVFFILLGNYLFKKKEIK
jgi:ABC-type transport system involved in multi-copper enzyme maturation permease subunit